VAFGAIAVERAMRTYRLQVTAGQKLHAAVLYRRIVNR
jgi:hypothetical protein